MAAYDKRLTEDYFTTLVDIDIFSSLEWVWFPGDVSNIHLILEQELLRDKGGGRLCQGKDIKSC
ncbi:MAG: hypothetical protein AB1480_16885 [Nitrospirota bacterium]